MSYVMLQPRSNTNDTDHYRVVDYEEWVAYRNGDTASYPSQERATATEAQSLCDQLNEPETGVNALLEHIADVAHG